MGDDKNNPATRSLWGWIFLIVTLLALGYWLARVVFPAIFAVAPS